MAYNRRTFTLDAQSEHLLRQGALAEGVNESELVRRRILLGAQLIEASRRVPGPRAEQFARIAVLPEDVSQPPGSEVMRIWVGHGGTDGRSRPPERPPAPVAPALPPVPEPEEQSHVVHLRVDDPDRTEFTDDAGELLPVDTACARRVDGSTATAVRVRVTCPTCLGGLG